MYNFSELKTQVGRLVQRSDDSNYLSNIVGTLINLNLEFLYNFYDYYNELEGKHNFTTVDGTEDYYMPGDFDKPFRLYDLTNKKPLFPKDEFTYFDANISNIASSTKEKAPSFYRIFEVFGVTKQVSSSGGLVQVKSSSSSDTSVVVRIEGFIDSALTVIGYENITVTGVVAVAGTMTFYKILHVSKAADSIGFITLENASGDDLVIMSPLERVAFHKVIKLGKIPNQANSLRLLYKRKFRKLVNDNDYPFVEADQFLIFKSTAVAYQQEKETLDRAAGMNQEAEKALTALINNIAGKRGPDFQHKMTSGFAQAHRS